MIFTKTKLIFIANAIVLCLIFILLLFLKLYPLRYSNPLLSFFSSIVFVAIVFWKYFIALICAVAVLGLISVFKKHKNGSGNFAFRIWSETILTTFGLALATAVGFFLSMGIQTGKPDLNPDLFFSYFNIVFVGYLITRFGGGLLLYFGKRRRL
jgi:hypothetical protein